jgi:hypothetical protein
LTAVRSMEGQFTASREAVGRRCLQMVTPRGRVGGAQVILSPLRTHSGVLLQSAESFFKDALTPITGATGAAALDPRTAP